MRISKKLDNLPEKYKILVIDDEQGIIDTIKVLLKDSKYTVTGFTNPDGLVPPHVIYQLSRV